MKLTLNAISKWAISALLLAFFVFSGGVAWADSESTAPESVSPTPTASGKSTIEPKHEDSGSSESSDDDDDDDDSDDDDDDDSDDDDDDEDEGQIDLDEAREALESRYDNPADVALLPKILVPNNDLIATQFAETGIEHPKRLPFSVFQLRHERVDMPLNAPPLDAIGLHKQATALNVIPVNIDSVKISTQTPADEFFTQASVLTAGLGSSAVALTAFVLMRGRGKDVGDH